MSVPFIDLLPQHKAIRREVLQALSRVVDSQRFILGENGRKLEKEVARYSGVSQAVGLASGSDALYLSLLALGIGKGDEVLTTPFTFFATAGAISRTGAKVVFCDIDPDTFNIDVRKISSKITRRSKAIVPVHLFGLSCDMDAILRVAKRHKLFVVEDAAQSFGAEYKGKKTGAIGHIGCFSFYPTKNLGGAGDGGMVVTSSKTLADRIRVLRDHGQTRKYFHEKIGINSRLDEIQAAVLLVKLKYLDRWNRQRRQHALFYNKAFADLPVRLPQDLPGAHSIYHLYSLVTERRDALSAYLTKHGISNSVYYPLPLHLQPCYRSLGHRKKDFPISERTANSILSLPLYAELPHDDRARVVRVVREFFS